jgi:hypothetical protein
MHVCTGARHPSMHVGISASSSAPSGAVRSDCIAVPHASSPRAACFAASTPSNSCHTGTSSTRSAWSTGRSLARYSSRYTSPLCVWACACACVCACSIPPPRLHPTPPRAPLSSPPPPAAAAAAALQASRAGACLSACAHVAGGSYATSCNIQRATYNVQHTTCSVQHTMCNMQHTTCNTQRATHNAQHTTCSIQRAAYSMKRAQMGPAELEKLYQIYQPSLLGELSAMAAVPPIPCPSFRPHLRRDWAHPRPHLRRDGAHPRPHLHWNRAPA